MQKRFVDAERNRLQIQQIVDVWRWGRWMGKPHRILNFSPLINLRQMKHEKYWFQSWWLGGWISGFEKSRTEVALKTKFGSSTLICFREIRTSWRRSTLKIDHCKSFMKAFLFTSSWEPRSKRFEWTCRCKLKMCQMRRSLLPAWAHLRVDLHKTRNEIFFREIYFIFKSSQTRKRLARRWQRH